MADAADLWRLSARDIAQLLARREVSPVELLDLALRRTGEINPQVNAIIHLNAGAHDAARASEAPAGPRRAVEPAGWHSIHR